MTHIIKDKNNRTANEDEIINIKIENQEQVISSYSYDENDKINKELGEFIVDKSKNVHMSRNIKLHFYSKEYVDESEVSSTVNNHFHDEYLESKKELSRLNIFILIMFALGVLTFAILLALYNRNVTNFYFEMILEIAAWVFIWESVDALFLQRPKIRRKCLQMHKLSVAKVSVVTNGNSSSDK